MIEGLADLAGEVPDWVLLGIVFLLGGGAGAAIQAVRDVALRAIEAIDDEPEPRRCMRPIDVLHDSDRMWSTLDRLRRSVGAERVLLFRQENGGKLPSLGKPLTSSIDLESADEDLSPVKFDWQHQLLDDFITRVLVRTYDEGCLEILPSTAKGILRGWLASSKDPTIHLFPVFSTEGAFYYIGICFRPDAALALDDVLYRDRVRVASAALVSIFSRWYKGEPSA